MNRHEFMEKALSHGEPISEIRQIIDTVESDYETSDSQKGRFYEACLAGCAAKKAGCSDSEVKGIIQSRLEGRSSGSSTESMLLSGVIGAATNSTILGAVLGGSVTGALLGDLFGGDGIFD